MSRGAPTGLFHEVIPTPAKKAVLPRMHMNGVDGDTPAPKRKRVATKVWEIDAGNGWKTRRPSYEEARGALKKAGRLGKINSVHVNGDDTSFAGALDYDGNDTADNDNR